MIPCALFASCSGLKTDELVKLILRVDELPASCPVLESISSYPWHVETKYYTADVNLCTTDKRTIGDKEFAQAVQAVVLTVDTTQLSSFEEVKMWIPYLKEIQSPVQVLVCDRSTDEDVVSRHSLIGWCLDNAFELVELNPLESDEGSDEDDFKESFGVQRLVEALSCHLWPNMVMKDKPSFRSPYFEKLMSDTASSNKSHNLDNSCQEPAQSNHSLEFNNTVNLDDTVADSTNKDVATQSHQVSTMTSTSDSKPATTLTQTAASGDSLGVMSQQIIDSLISEADSTTDESEESFEKLFEKLQIMKETAASLPSDERKDYAKRVTMEFWKAIGGDMEEIDGLSDSDDDHL